MTLGKVDNEIEIATGDIMTYVWDGTSWIPQKSNTSGELIIGGSLVKEDFDYIALTYVAEGYGAGEVETVVYKTGGATGDTVATLTLAYNVSNEVISITKT